MLFFFNDTATTEIYTLSLHDALPISARSPTPASPRARARRRSPPAPTARAPAGRPWPRAPTATWAAPTCWTTRAGSRGRSEEHTSELQSRQYLVCRLLLEKKKNIHTMPVNIFLLFYSSNLLLP